MANKPKKIGNTEYKDIQDKQYVTIEGDAAAKTAQALTEQNIPFSGLDYGDKTKFTVSAENLDKFKSVAFDVSQEQTAAAPAKEEPTATPTKEEQTAAQQQKPQRDDIIGNTEYKSIPDKQYFTLRTPTAEKVAKALDEAGIKFSGRVDGEETKLTISAADVDKYKTIAYDTVFVDKSAKEKPAQQKSEIIGNAEYKDIPDKQYAKVSPEKAQSMAKVFEEKGVPFSALIKGDKATITLSGKDMQQFKAALSEPEKAEKKSIMGQLKDNKAKTSQQQNQHMDKTKSKGAER